MSYFKPAPQLNLETTQELIDLLRAGTYPDGVDTFSIRSTYIVEAIKDVMKRENRDMAYNTEVVALVRERLAEFISDLPKEVIADEGSMLSRLVYNAQCYRRSEEYVAGGYEPFTDELVQMAFEQGKKIDVLSDTGITIIVNGEPYVAPKSYLTVRKIADKLYSFRPRMRNKYVIPDGRPAKLVSA
jgi:hypothetical protein